MIQEAKTAVHVHHVDDSVAKPVIPIRWYQQMDGLRFIAVTSVLIEHFAHFIGERFRLGFFGVDLFFVISGFLISEGLFIDKQKNKPSNIIRRFYLKRFLRIFPIYYLVLIVALIFYPPFQQIAAWAFTYTVNYYPRVTGHDVVSPFPHLWSLAVEEQFYLFWPCVILFVPKRLFSTVFGLIFIGSITYLLLYHNWWELPSRMYSLCLGAFLAYAKMKWPEKYKEHITARFVFILAAAVAIHFYELALGLSVLSFGLVYLASNNAYKSIFKKVLESKSVIYIGKISYGIYLYHMLIAFVVGKYVVNPLWDKIDFSFFPTLKFQKWALELPLYGLLTFIIAHLSFTYFEKPILKLKSKLS